MFFLNPKKAKQNQEPTPKWFTGLMLIFFAFVVYRAMYPADTPDGKARTGAALLEEMPSLKRVVTGETFDPATSIMEVEEAAGIPENDADTPAPLEAKVEIVKEATLKEKAPDEPLEQPAPEADTKTGDVPNFTIRATNGKGQPVELLYEKDDNGALSFGEAASHTIIIPPQNGQEMRVITIKRVD